MTKGRKNQPRRRFRSLSLHMCGMRSSKASKKNRDYQFSIHITCHSSLELFFFSCIWFITLLYICRFPLAPSFVSASRTEGLIVDNQESTVCFIFPSLSLCAVFYLRFAGPEKKHNSDDTKRRSTVLKKAKSEEEMQNIRRRDNCWRTKTSLSTTTIGSFGFLLLTGLSVVVNNPARLTPTLRPFPMKGFHKI